MELSNKNIGEFLEWWHLERHKCRTDLLYLCNVVLGYPDVSRRVHGPILDMLQHFPGAIEHHKTVQDFSAALKGKVLWEPKCDLRYLPPNEGSAGNRKTLTLFPRKHLKSTIATVAHSIQWILNYPNVRILLTTATEDLGVGFVIEIRDHFRKNEQLRQLFPELCPQSVDGKTPELGNLSGFMCPGRDNNNLKLGPGGKDQTLYASTVGSSITGYHGDVEKTDDAVEKINSSSQSGIDEVIRHLGSMGDLLDSYNSIADEPLQGWHDVIGTPWDFSDAYQVIRNNEDKRKEEGLPPEWDLVIRSAAPNWPDGPYLWPERMGYKALKSIEDDPWKGPAQLSAQYLMNPIVAGQGLIDDLKKLRWMAEQECMSLIANRQLTGRLDLAGMDENAKGQDNDFTCLTLGCFANGTIVLPFMRHGRPPVEEVVAWIFQVFREWPMLRSLVVEKASGGSVVESWLRREMSATGIWLPVSFVTRSNRESKVTRIKALRPWFMGGKIVINSAVPYRTVIEQEVKGFPKYRHDDWLDTVSDLMVENKGVSSGVYADRKQEEWERPPMTDPISLLIAEHDVEFGFYGKVDEHTGFPC